MKRILTLLLAACMLFGCIIPVSADVASGTDLATQDPTVVPTEAPTAPLTEVPTAPPTEVPTEVHTEVPTVEVTEAPATEAPVEATDAPTEAPAAQMTEVPAEATEVPAETPAGESTDVPTAAPSEEVTAFPTEAPAGGATEEPAQVTDAPTEIPSEEATDTPTEEVSAAPTEVPSAEVTEIPTENPAGESTDTPTEVPTEVLTEVPTPEITPEPTAEPTPTAPTTDYGSGPLYVLDGELKHYGQPEELILLGQTLYLYHSGVVELEGSIEELSRLSFALDKEVFTDEDDVIYLSVRDPNGVVKENTVFLWAGKKEDKTDVSDRLDDVIDAEDSELLEREIQVTASGYVSGEGCSPTFRLTALPEKDADMTFAVIIDGADPAAISGSSYAPKASGEYRFALLAADGSVLARSGKYSVIYTEPTPEPTEKPTPEVPTEEPTPEVTEAPTAEPTPEVTEIPTEEPTPEATEVPTEEPTPEATEAPTEEPTPEATEAPTEEPTPEATEAPTEEPTPEETEAPTEEPTPEVTDTPTAESTPEVTEEPTEEPTPEVTEVPTEEPTPEVTEEPTEEPTPEATEIPTEEPTPEIPTPVLPMATESPMPEPTAEPTPTLDDLLASMDSFVSANTGSAESGVIAWAMIDGQPVSGSLKQLLESGCDTIYIATTKTIVIEGVFVSLSGVTLLPDPDVFGDDYVVSVSETSNLIEREDSLFVTVVRKSDAEEVTASLNVDAGSHTANWTNAAPVFQLAAEPDLPGTVGGYSYAVSVNGGAPVRLSDNSYAAAEEGSYALRFCILDPDGNAVAQSADYAVKLDLTLPLLRVTSDRSGNLTVIAGDMGSGAVSCSLDGGATWLQLADQGEGVSAYATTLTATTEYAPGQIIVQDRAGNRASNEEKVSVSVMKFGSGGYRGGSSRSTSHSSSTEETVTVYNGVELILDDGSMSQLTVGDETLDMFLRWDEAEPGKENTSFTASFTSLDGSVIVDTLVLTASGVKAEDAAQYTWQFSGLVYKKLAASGIDYLALRVGERVTLLSTAGFSAGIRYSMYRAEGLPSKDFMYTLRMGLPEDQIELDVTVGGETWRLTDDETAEFYYYDVFTGLMTELNTLRD